MLMKEIQRSKIVRFKLRSLIISNNKIVFLVHQGFKKRKEEEQKERERERERKTTLVLRNRVYKFKGLSQYKHSERPKIGPQLLPPHPHKEKFKKNCVFFTVTPPSPTSLYKALNASVQSLLLAGNFLYNQQQPSAGEEEVANFREFLEKKTIFNEYPV